MRTSASFNITVLILGLLSGCARGGACRPAPDPVPADCKPGQACPVDGESPSKPIEQPAPADPSPVDTPPPT